MEERNSSGYTPFHLALGKGNVPVLQYFLNAHAPEDSEEIYKQPPSKSTLSIALESHKPEVVWMILNNKLATKENMGDAWTFITRDDRKTSQKARGLAKPDESMEEITNLLMTFGGFSKVPENASEHSPVPQANETARSSPSQTPPVSNEPSPNRNQRHKSDTPHVDEPSTPVDQQTAAENRPDESSSDPYQNGQPPLPHGRGRGRGKGRGRGRGRGFRGRGRGGVPS